MGESDRTATARIIDIELDERLIVRRSPEVEHERAVAIYDLLEENLFDPVGTFTGPFKVKLQIRDGRSLVFDVHDEAGDPLTAITIPLSRFRRLVKDYFKVCESYFDAIKNAPPSRIEAIDMGRRSLHNDGADLLRQLLANQVVIDDETSRRLFTLVCVLHIRG